MTRTSRQAARHGTTRALCERVNRTDDERTNRADYRQVFAHTVQRKTRQRESFCCLRTRCTKHWRFQAGPGRGTAPPQIVVRPPNIAAVFLTHCGQLSILRKISKSNATRCQILRLKWTKFDFRWGFAQTPLGELTALPRPPSCI